MVNFLSLSLLDSTLLKTWLTNNVLTILVGPPVPWYPCTEHRAPMERIVLTRMQLAAAYLIIAKMKVGSMFLCIEALKEGSDTSAFDLA